MEYEEIASLELYPATELTVYLRKLPSGEEVIMFEDCTGNPPIIYAWCLDMANEWLKGRLMKKAIVSRAHEWVAVLPVADRKLICTRCGVTTTIGQWDTQPCNEHFESETSGFIS